MAGEQTRDRAYAGAHDLRAMQQLVARNFADTDWRVGDLAWAVRESTHLELSLRVRLVADGADVLGWTWVRSRGLIEVELAASHRDRATYSSLIAAGESVVAAMVGAGDAVGEMRVWVSERDPALIAAVAERGYAAAEVAMEVNRRDSLDEIPEPRQLPAGWGFAAVDSEERAQRRVECHRAAFAPSALTAVGYSRVRRTWPYRSELDRVIVDDRGDVVAACTSWLDEANSDGLLEPVATSPSEQRHGYGRAVCIDALLALREAGARTAQVGCIAGSAACASYRAIGFEPAGRITSYTKQLARR